MQKAVTIREKNYKIDFIKKQNRKCMLIKNTVKKSHRLGKICATYIFVRGLHRFKNFCNFIKEQSKIKKVRVGEKLFEKLLYDIDTPQQEILKWPLSMCSTSLIKEMQLHMILRYLRAWLQLNRLITTNVSKDVEWLKLIHSVRWYHLLGKRSVNFI